MWMRSLLILGAALCTAAISLEENTGNVRIIGGRNVTMRDYSYQVSLQHGVNRQHICGGVFIGRYTVLTTAFCITQAGSNATQIHIRFGSVNHSAGGSERQAQRVIIHPNFNATSFENDIAIIKLQRSARRVKRVTLPPPRFALRTNDNVTVSGWSRLPGQLNISTILQAVDLQVLDQQACVNVFQFLPNLPNVTNRMWCAGWPAGGRGVCPGTHGGPVVRRGRRNIVLHGLVSWSNDCRLQNFPIVLTRISDYVGWIAANR